MFYAFRLVLLFSVSCLVFVEVRDFKIEAIILFLFPMSAEESEGLQPLESKLFHLYILYGWL